MRAVHSALPVKASESLAAIVGCDVETARRYFTGKRTPNGDAFLAMLGSDVGPAFVGHVARTLSLKQRVAIAQAALGAEDRFVGS